MGVAAYFLSAALFVSTFFSVLAPTPLMITSFRFGSKKALAAMLVNAALVYLLLGRLSASLFAVFVVLPSLCLSFFLEKRWALEKSAGLTLVAMAVAAIGVEAGFRALHWSSLWMELRAQSLATLDYLSKTATQIEDLDAWKAAVLEELPSMIAIFALAIVWVNLVFTLRANPGNVLGRLGLSSAFTRLWKAPEWLVWPTILCGAVLLLGHGTPYIVAMNVFRFIMAIYLIQGLSILGFFMDAWRFRGFLRAILVVCSVVFAMPVVLVAGFFDQWFDFRGKLKRIPNEKS